MRNKLVYKYIGKVLIVFSILLLFPLLVSIIYKEPMISFMIPALISLIAGLILNNIEIDNKNLYAKDGFVIVTMGWFIISLIGALPFMISDKLSFFDSLFESVSGLTATGASVYEDIEHLTHGLLFWRSFSNFIGGLGVLAFVMAIVPLSKNDKSMHVLKAEMPGPKIAKLVPSIKKTLFYLFGIYISLTLIEFLLLIIGDIKVFDSLLISLGTAGTGGFTLLNSSLATYSPYVQWVVTIFMFLFGINFNIYFLLLIKDFKTILKSEELKVYIFIFIAAITFIVLNTYTMFDTLGEAIRQSAFHTSSIMTSTGYTIGDISFYPTTCRVLIIFLTLVSACAGSTCGGFKISRLIICLKTIKRDILKTFHPNSVRTIMFEGKKVEEDTIKSNSTFLFLYIGVLLLIMFLISFEGLTLGQTIDAAITTFSNAGLCFDIKSFSIFSDFSKFVLSIGMLFGRLEIFPIIVWASSFKK